MAVTVVPGIGMLPDFTSPWMEPPAAVVEAGAADCAQVQAGAANHTTVKSSASAQGGGRKLFC
jgi:hypothetical protein